MAKEERKQVEKEEKVQDAIVAAPLRTSKKIVPSSSNTAVFAESKDTLQ